MAAVLTPVQTKQIRINTHKRNTTKTQYKQYKNTVNTSTHITKTPTKLKTKLNSVALVRDPHITKPVQTTTVQDTHQMKWSQYNQVPSV